MIELNSAIISKAIIHRVGHKGRDESNYISKTTFEPDETASKLLLEYFLKTFKNPTYVFNFKHLMDIKMNEVYTSCNNIFDKEDFIYNSKNILKHLYEQSKHPNIKSGDLFIVYFEDLLFENKLLDAVGIFKSERKENFFKLKDVNGSLKLDIDTGISIQKLDKGCLVFNTNYKKGFKVLTYENANQDTEYWRNDFLGISLENDNNFQTNQFITLCKEFSEEIIKPKLGKQGQVNFMNKTMGVLSKNETIRTDEFKDLIFQDNINKKLFNGYKNDFASKNDFDFNEQIRISRPVLQLQKKRIKNEIRLDTNIHIKIDVNNPESSQRFIERGFDHKRNMNFYKIYFNDEI